MDVTLAIAVGLVATGLGWAGPGDAAELGRSAVPSVDRVGSSDVAPSPVASFFETARSSDVPVRLAQVGHAPHRDSAIAASVNPDLAPVGAGLPLSALLPSFPVGSASAPKRSDVILSPRFERPGLTDAVRAYQPTRLEWSYIKTPAVIEKLKAAVPGHFGASINNNTPTPNNAGAALDIDGKPIIAPWMRSWGAVWNSCARPAGMQALKDAAAAALALGADSLQMDDPGMQLESEYFGAGDFSPENIRGFAKWVQQQSSNGAATAITPSDAARYGQWLKTDQGIKNAADYAGKRASIPAAASFRSYMRASVTQCLTELKESLAANKRTNVPLSLNIHTPYPWGPSAFLVPIADYVVGEVDDASSEFQHLYLFTQWLRSEGKRWVPVFPSNDKNQLRLKIIASYAIGATPMVPWDVWVPPRPSSSTPQSRYYGNPADFVDLFAFARKNARLLDGFEVISRLNLLIERDQPKPADALEQLKRLSEMQVSYVPILRVGERSPSNARRDPMANRTLLLSSRLQNPDGGIKSLASETDGRLRDLSAGQVDQMDYRLIVTAHADIPNKRVVHIIRQSNANINQNITVTLHEWTLPPGDALRVSVWSPQNVGANRLGILRRSNDASLKVEINRPADWLILEIEP